MLVQQAQIEEHQTLLWVVQVLTWMFLDWKYYLKVGLHGHPHTLLTNVVQKQYWVRW